jgi:hypothetical protein
MLHDLIDKLTSGEMDLPSDGVAKRVNDFLPPGYKASPILLVVRKWLEGI